MEKDLYNHENSVVTGQSEGSNDTPGKEMAALDDLEPQRQLHYKLWLMDNPGTSETHFNQHIWQHFRASILRQREQSVEIVRNPKRNTARKRLIKRLGATRKAG